PVTWASTGVLTVGSLQVASTVWSAVALWPFPDTTRRMPYDCGSAGVNVVGLVDVEEKAGWAGTGLTDQANAYVGANRAGHFEGSESSEKCGPTVDTAVSVQSSIGRAPPAWA